MKNEQFAPGLKLPLLEEVENRLQELFRQRKEEIEKELEERIRREREEAERKIKDIEQEYERGRQLLTDYHQVLYDFEAERVRLQEEIKERFQRVIQHQTEIEKLASMTLEEIKVVDELNSRLENLEKTSGEKIAWIRQQIEEKYGIVTEMPELAEEGEVKLDLEKELERLKKIKELLAGEISRLESGSQPEAEVTQGEKAQETEEIVAGGNTIEVVEGEKTEEEEGERLEQAPETSLAEEVFSAEAEVAAEAETFREVFERLENFRRVYSEGNGEIPYYEKEGRMIIDAENLVTNMNEALDSAHKLYQKLSQTDSPKEHFFIKQEIINQQEMLRKQLLRVTKLCEKEGFILPHFTEEILNVGLLRDLLERLSIENWSDEIDFQAFTEFVESLKENFYRRITPPVVYLKAILQELNGE